jgi:hypothetical protein
LVHSTTRRAMKFINFLISPRLIHLDSRFDHVLRFVFAFACMMMTSSMHAGAATGRDRRRRRTLYGRSDIYT